MVLRMVCDRFANRLRISTWIPEIVAKGSQDDCCSRRSPSDSVLAREFCELDTIYVVVAMTSLLASITKEGSGKTAIVLALSLLAQDRGHSVGYMKPKGTQLASVVGKTLDEDPLLARELLNFDAELDQVEPIIYSQPFAEHVLRGREDIEKLHQTVTANYQALADECDLLLIEGGGRYTTGGLIDLTDVDIVDLFDTKVVLISRFENIWDLDDVLAATNHFGDRLVGVIFNAVTDANFDHVVNEVVPFLHSRDISVLGVLPRIKELAGISISNLATELGAEVLTDDVTTATFIERFLVGAMRSESALQYFRRTKDAALITGGDRSDIQTTALEAPEIKCLILTGGFQPSPAVVGKAEEHGVPLLLVPSDTHTTIDRVEAAIPGRTRDEQTVHRMQELLTQHADIDTLLDTVLDTAASNPDTDSGQ